MANETPLSSAFRRNDAGASAVEFALIAPVMLVMLMGLLDYAVAVFHRTELESAARAGAQYALVDGFDATTITTAVEASTNLDTNFLTVTVTESCECPEDSPPTVSCSDTCGVGSMTRYANIDLSYTHTWFFLPGTTTLTGESIIRTE